MGIGLNILTSPEASSWVQDSAFQVLSEGSLKAVGRPLFTMADKNAAPEARKYSAIKEFTFQGLSMLAYFMLVKTVVQKGGFNLLKKMPTFKNFDALKKCKDIESFTGIFDAAEKLAKTNKKFKNSSNWEQLALTKGAMEGIKMIGSGVILTILCPMFVTKLVHPIMGFVDKHLLDKKGPQKNQSGDTFAKTAQTK